MIDDTSPCAIGNTTAMHFRARTYVRTAAIAGIVAGSSATAVELALWWVHGDPLPATAWRDVRFAAAIVLGRSVLPPPQTFDATLLFVATIVHFALSIVYALLLLPAIAGLRPVASIAAGALFGCALYVVNMYGFSAAYPWFEATRDSITFAAHIAFGVGCAAVQPLCSWRAGRMRRH